MDHMGKILYFHSSVETRYNILQFFIKSWLIQCLTKYNKSKVFKEPVRSLMACIHIQLIHCRRCHSRLNYEKNFKRMVSLEQGQKVSNPFFKGTLLLQFS